MVFLFGANLPERHMVPFALRRIFGVGPFKSNRICHQLGIHPRCRVEELSEAQLSAIAQKLEADPDRVGHELQRKIGQNVQRLWLIKSQRGDRLARGLPSRNQHTQQHGDTAKKRLGQFVKLTPFENASYPSKA